jgi:predicted nucleotidyltransferase component of viral defense system
MKILTPKQKLAIRLLANSPLKEKFYWTGGTLLAYHYLHHRLSHDLDFFSDEPFSFSEIEPLIKQIARKAGFQKIAPKKIFDRWEIVFHDPEQLRVEFVHYNHEKKQLGKRGKLLGVQIDSLKDIAANKTFAYFDRNEPKDLFDLYFLIKKKKFTPKKLLDLTKEKFGIEFPEDAFWSESFKVLPLLKTIKPLIVIRDQKEENILEKIQGYFKFNSQKFLASKLTV